MSEGGRKEIVPHVCAPTTSVSFRLSHRMPSRWDPAHLILQTDGTEKLPD